MGYAARTLAGDLTRPPRLPQKLLAYGLLKGDVAPPDQPDKLVIDQVVETICECFAGESTPDNVSLQIVKVRALIDTVL